MVINRGYGASQVKFTDDNVDEKEFRILPANQAFLFQQKICGKTHKEIGV